MARARMRKAVAVLVVLAAAAMAWSAPAGAAMNSGLRVALVVGNGGYDPANISRLANPVNDARLMATTLERVGFEVTLETDAGQVAMRRAIKAFGKRLRGAGRNTVGLFYYAGHGVEAGGDNYLIPLGADVESATDLQSDAVPAQWVLSRMEEAGNRLNMVILDACRNNPYEGRVRGGGRGLARMDAPSGSLIAYSAAPGQSATDGEGENSPYTLALAAALAEPGLQVEAVFKRVRVRVEDETGRRGRMQTPWEMSSLRGDFYFVPPNDVGEGGETVAGAVGVAADGRLEGGGHVASTQRMATEREFWASIKDSRNPAEFEAYLKKYGKEGEFASLARIRITTLPSEDSQSDSGDIEVALVAGAQPVGEAMKAEEALALGMEYRVLVQEGLASLGFRSAPSDGDFGPRTRAALTLWQEAQGYEPTGYVTRRQAQMLKSLGEKVRVKAAAERWRREQAEAQAGENALGLTHDERILVQGGLAALGLEPGVADGTLGERTRTALRAYQSNKGVATTGHLTGEQAETLMALGEEVARKAAEKERRADDAAFARASSRGTLRAYLRYKHEHPRGNHLFLKNMSDDFPDLSGTYDIVTGTNPDGSGYGGVVTISRPDKRGYRYCLKWRIANTKQEEHGCGDLEVDFTRKTLLLSVDWGSSYPVVYDVSDTGDSLVGSWHSGAGKENLKRR